MQKKAVWKKLWNQRWCMAQKWLWWSDNGKIFNSNNSNEFWCRFPVRGGNTNSPELLLLKILPLSDHHSHFWATTFDFTTFFMLPFFAWAAPFLQFGCFCVDIVLPRVNSWYYRTIWYYILLICIFVGYSYKTPHDPNISLKTIVINHDYYFHAYTNQEIVHW